MFNYEYYQYYTDTSVLPDATFPCDRDACIRLAGIEQVEKAEADLRECNIINSVPLLDGDLDNPQYCCSVIRK